MNTANTKRVAVQNISFIAKSGNMRDSSFIINENTDPQWLSINFMKRVYTSMGLALSTSFQMFRGSTIKYQELNVTEQMLAEQGGKVAVLNKLTGREIEFTTPGLKRFGHQMDTVSPALEKAIFASGVSFNTGWADDMATQAAPRAAQAPVVEEHEEVGGEDLGEEVPPVNAAPPVVAGEGGEIPQ